MEGGGNWRRWGVTGEDEGGLLEKMGGGGN